MTVLILAREIEPQVDRLVEELAARDVPVFRTDLAAFPQRLTLDARPALDGWNGTLGTERRTVQLRDIRSIWYRHPAHFELSEGMSRPERRHAAAEARVGVAGVLCSLDVLWVNYPSRESDALKPRQLDVARRCGLQVPETLITNSPAGVRDFAAAVGGPLAGKNLSAASLIESGHIQTAYTRRLGPGDLADLSGVETTAHLFQRFIDDKAFEVRATVVGGRVFAAAIHARSDTARIDFRADYPASTTRSSSRQRRSGTGCSRSCARSASRLAHSTSLSPAPKSGSCSNATRSANTAGSRIPSTSPSPRPWPTSSNPGHRVNYPTDLSPDEQERARARLADLAEKFTAKHILRTPAWRDVFERTWRHPYVPGYYPDKDTPLVLCIDPARRGEWLDAVYSDATLITKVMSVPLSRPLRPGTGTMFTSSSTGPSLVLAMLEVLDVADGHRVLEIGTGTGYNAALLCERLGSAQVTSVDIDPELVDLAGERLAANGHTPALATVDGEAGYPTGAPYDRIIATCAVPTIPRAWLEQAAPDAVILADVHGPLGGTLARLTVDASGTAVGRFVSHWAGFMTMRHNVDQGETFRPWVSDPNPRVGAQLILIW